MRHLAFLMLLAGLAGADGAGRVRTARMGEYAFRCRMAEQGVAMGDRCEVLRQGKVVLALDTASRFVFAHGYPFHHCQAATTRIALFRDVRDGQGMRIYLDFRKGRLVGTDSLPWFPKDPMEGVR